MPAKPIGLRAEHRAGGNAQADILCAEIDCGPSRLRCELGTLRVDALEHRPLLLLRWRRTTPSKTRKLGLSCCRTEQQCERENSLAHQSTTPDQSGSDPPCGMVTGRASLPSSATRARPAAPLAPARWNRISRLLAAQAGPSSPGPLVRTRSPV